MTITQLLHSCLDEEWLHAAFTNYRGEHQWSSPSTAMYIPQLKVCILE